MRAGSGRPLSHPQRGSGASCTRPGTRRRGGLCPYSSRHSTGSRCITASTQVSLMAMQLTCQSPSASRSAQPFSIAIVALLSGREGLADAEITLAPHLAHRVHDPRGPLGTGRPAVGEAATHADGVASRDHGLAPDFGVGLRVDELAHRDQTADRAGGTADIRHDPVGGRVVTVTDHCLDVGQVGLRWSVALFGRATQVVRAEPGPDHGGGVGGRRTCSRSRRSSRPCGPGKPS